ncbi:hypothetical protein IHC93_04725 [Photobacterium damselae subsp. damselae]|uniref:hypothetical protein n=1 Tax=Photobacterium damselae TaxID=38293 RepID=UPI001F4359DC|nr:hypothetical protein [Photobacterium damselae]UKA26163.1 hypothetical protein IHC93_04725 [Photobacterium damselae subsp. damselae]
MSKLNTNQEDDISNLKIVSYDSEGNPFSYYSDDKWIIMKESVYLNFKNLTGDFKSKCKELIYSEFNSNRLINKKVLGINIFKLLFYSKNVLLNVVAIVLVI